MTNARSTLIGLASLITAVALGMTALPATAAIVDRGNLIVTASASPNPSAAGGQAVYAVTVKNDSSFTALKVLVTVTLPTGPDFVKCSPSVKAQVCTVTNGVLTTTFATLKAHTTVKVSITLRMPTGGASDYTFLAKAHAPSAIGNDDPPRDGNTTTVASVLPGEKIPVTFLPSTRTGTISCGGTISGATFQGSEDTIQLGGSMGCANAKVGITMAASNKILDLNKYKIVGAATDQVLGSVGIMVAATNVTILGGATKSSSGLEYFDYCLKDGAGSTGLTVRKLRCFRSRSVGIDLQSDDVEVNESLVDLVAGGTPTTTETPGGVGVRVTGQGHLKNVVARRTTTIGMWLGGTGGVQVDGAMSTSRIEGTTGIGILAEGAGHTIKDTSVEGDGDDGVSTTGVLVSASGVLIDGVQVADFGGDGFSVSGDAVSILRSTVEAVGIDSFVVTGAGAKLSGNGASRNLRGFVVTGANPIIETNTAEKTGGIAFVVSGDGATMNGNSAKSGNAEGFVLSGNGGTYNTNRAELNNGTGYTISGDNGTFESNTAKGQKKGNGFLVTGTGNTFETNSAEKNKAAEYVFAAGNLDGSSNKKNGKVFTFGLAGGSFE